MAVAADLRNCRGGSFMASPPARPTPAKVAANAVARSELLMPSSLKGRTIGGLRAGAHRNLLGGADRIPDSITRGSLYATRAQRKDWPCGSGRARRKISRDA